jgi:cell shape-determining protein MreC
VGEFKDEKYNGEGTLYSPNGSIINQGIWTDNIFIRSAKVQQATAPSVQQSNTLNPEIERLRAEAQEAKRKQTEAEELMRVRDEIKKK